MISRRSSLTSLKITRSEKRTKVIDSEPCISNSYKPLTIGHHHVLALSDNFEATFLKRVNRP